MATRWNFSTTFMHRKRTLTGRDRQFCAQSVSTRVSRVVTVCLHGAERHIVFVRDNHDALIVLIDSPRGLKLFAPWNLLRRPRGRGLRCLGSRPRRELRTSSRAPTLEYPDEIDHKNYYNDDMIMTAGFLEHAEDFAKPRESFESAIVNNGNILRAKQILGFPSSKAPFIQGHRRTRDALNVRIS